MASCLKIIYLIYTLISHLIAFLMMKSQAPSQKSQCGKCNGKHVSYLSVSLGLYSY